MQIDPSPPQPPVAAAIFPEAIAVLTVRCVVVVDESLSAGHAANATGVLALTLGATVPGLPGEPLIDADGSAHPGLIPQGVTVLRAPTATLSRLRSQAEASGQLSVIDFPTEGQRTTDYDEVRRQVSATPSEQLQYVAILIYGPRRAVSRLTGNLPLLR